MKKFTKFDWAGLVTSLLALTFLAVGYLGKNKFENKRPEIQKKKKTYRVLGYVLAVVSALLWTWDELKNKLDKNKDGKISKEDFNL